MNVMVQYWRLIGHQKGQQCAWDDERPNEREGFQSERSLAASFILALALCIAKGAFDVGQMIVANMVDYVVSLMMIIS